jgi:ABC-type Na+ transport system ATPase subunit NatA
MRKVAVVEKILSTNEQLAEGNRKRLDDFGVFSMNIMASPGAGKTSLIEQTITGLSGRWNLAVIDGDIATSLDADRAAAAVESYSKADLPERLLVNRDARPLTHLYSLLLAANLTVEQNIRYFADLHGVGDELRRERQTRLLAMTQMERFTDRRAARPVRRNEAEAESVLRADPPAGAAGSR